MCGSPPLHHFIVGSVSTFKCDDLSALEHLKNSPKSHQNSFRHSTHNPISTAKVTLYESPIIPKIGYWTSGYDCLDGNSHNIRALSKFDFKNCCNSSDYQGVKNFTLVALMRDARKALRRHYQYPAFELQCMLFCVQVCHFPKVHSKKTIIKLLAYEPRIRLA